MNQSHGFVFYTIEGKSPSWEVDIDAKPLERTSLERGLCVAVPGCVVLPVPTEAPGEVVSRNTTIAFLSFSVDAFAGQANIGACPRDLHLKIVPVKVQALLGQHLAPVYKPARVVWVGMLPRGGVGDLAIILLQP